MNIPLTILKLHRELKARGDNGKIAEMASTSRKKYAPRDVGDAWTRGRADANIVLAMSDFYSEKYGKLKPVNKSLKKVKEIA